MNRRGAILRGCLVWLLLASLVAYAGVHIGEPYYRYYRFRDLVAQQVHFGATRADTLIEHDLTFAADTLGMPEGAYHFNVARDDNTLRITTDYDDAWSLLHYVRPVHFTIDEHAP